MGFKIPFLSNIPVEITQVNIAYNSTTHSFGGIKGKKRFVYKLPFANTETVPMRVLRIEVDKPFVLRKMNYSLPTDVESGQKIVFELRCEYDGNYSYSGPLGIRLMALPIGSRLFKK
ncbi:MAG: hypothetical protein KGH61_02125 [Candidatus Micrarchaeota archaeon]|nr:hypothetical protein [Candidatus Micrarchaeota archaeon]MDE1847727.1 hypothetical protein [Candidatus Micrarchaeota archaeon]MDE1864156.1 hypothetical protein [Candidatus Micrarchaeota archaeon]